MMGRNRGRYVKQVQDVGSSKKQPRLVRDLTVVITNVLFRECENTHCKKCFQGRLEITVRLMVLPGNKTEITTKQN